jgi:alanine racemase
VMTWRARVTALKNVAKGQSVSYGATWSAPRASQIAVVPTGYADGYLRALSNCGEVLVNGQRAPVVGRVTMDQIMVDVTGISVQIGDEVTLFGAGLPVEEVAARAGTISYELLCAVSSRVPRVFSGNTGDGRQETEE